jgi:signal transduction histidine kinase
MMLRRYFGSMAGRLFLFLLIGVSASASLALGVADVRRQSDLRRIELDRAVDRVQDFVSLANSQPRPVREQLVKAGVPGLIPPHRIQKITHVDGELSARMTRQIGVPITAQLIDPATCFRKPITQTVYFKMNCWRVSARLADGMPFNLTLLSPTRDDLRLPELEPVYVIIMVLGVSMLTYLAARMAAAPLADLSRAARDLAGNLDSLPLPQRGPYEVRDAIEAFNTMQARLRAHVAERTKILASITHDLQTPLTRHRLRLEKVTDVALRSRLIDDLRGMQILIREGLEFSRGTQTDEPFAPVSLESLLESLVEDAVDMGQRVTLARPCNFDVEARPRALQRCLANLVDNAIKHGSSAEIGTEALDGARLMIRVRDHGPGIPPEYLERVFEPFVRLDDLSSEKTDGAGLGLTIARMLAAKNDAELSLVNHPQGGLEARLVLSRGVHQHDNLTDWSGFLQGDHGAPVG